MFKIIRRVDKLLLLFVALTIAGSAIGCEWFPESTFELASRSRLPKWIVLPPGLTRADVSITMSYYLPLWAWGRSAIFILRDTKGNVLVKVKGKLRGLGPNYLKQPPSGSLSKYPSYEVITVNNVIIEHRKMEPIFYITDDPAVWKELGVGQK
jgi:hypothetical protein